MSAMKTAGFFIFVIILAVPLIAQDFQPLPAPPKVIGVPFYLDSSAGELKKLGYAFVTLDLLVYRTGSLNEALGVQDLASEG